MEYKIIGFNKNVGQITVQFENQWTFAIDLPIVDGRYPTGEALEQTIQNFAPNYLKERQTLLAQGIANEQEIADLVAELPPTESVQTATQNQDAAFEERLAVALVKLGILDSNPA